MAAEWSRQTEEPTAKTQTIAAHQWSQVNHHIVKTAIHMPTWSRFAVIKYVLLQVLELACIIILLIVLKRWISFPSWSLWIVAFLVILKDLVMFPSTWRAYDKTPPASVIGTEGTVTNRCAPYGYVRIRGELWRSKVIGDHAVVDPGATVIVIDMEGLTLLVKPRFDDDTP